MLLAICTTQVKKRAKEVFKKKKSRVTKNLLQGDSNLDHQNQLELTGHASVNLRSSVVVVAFFASFASLW